MLIALVAAYLIVALVSVAFLLPRLRNRLPFAWLRRLALLWGLVVVGYTLLSPACVYLPSVPAAPATRRVLLGEDQGQLYWLEGTTTRFAFAAGPRVWFTNLIPGLPFPAGLQFIPPLRLAGMDEREQRWELVRSDGRRLSYPPDPDGFYLSGSQVVAGGGELVFSTGTTNPINRFDAASGTRKPFASEPEGTGYPETLGKTDRGLLAVFEQTKFVPGAYGKKRDILVREVDLTGQVIREKGYVLDDWARGYRGTSGRALYVAFADGKTFAAQVALRPLNEGLGKVLLFPESGEAVEVCSFAYDYYLPLSFAVSPDGRYFSTGQAVWRMDGSHVMPLVPALRMVTWQGSSLVGIRSFPLVGEYLLGRHININAMLDWVRTTDPEVVSRRYGSPGLRFAGVFENLSMAVRRRPAWYGGLDDSGGADEIVRVEVK